MIEWTAESCHRSQISNNSSFETEGVTFKELVNFTETSCSSYFRFPLYLLAKKKGGLKVQMKHNIG